MDQFGALCSISRLSNSSPFLWRSVSNFHLEGIPAAQTTLKDKYPFSPEHFPSVCLTFSLPAPFLSHFPFLCFISIHISLMLDPVKASLLPCLLLSLCVSAPLFWCKISLFCPLVFKWTHLYTPLSSTTLSSHHISFDFKLFMNPDKPNKTRNTAVKMATFSISNAWTCCNLWFSCIYVQNRLLNFYY